MNASAIWNFLKGKKTYILSVAGFAYASGIQMGYWPHNHWVDFALGLGLSASFRHGMDSAAQNAIQKLSSVNLPQSQIKP